jgi:hypothetical protein
VLHRAGQGAGYLASQKPVHRAARLSGHLPGPLLSHQGRHLRSQVQIHELSKVTADLRFRLNLQEHPLDRGMGWGNLPIQHGRAFARTPSFRAVLARTVIRGCGKHQPGCQGGQRDT